MEIDTSTRLVIAGATFAFFAILEAIYPHRAAYTEKSRRWGANLGLFVVDLLAVGIPLGTVAFGLILFAESQTWGLMHMIDLPFWVKAVVGFICLDALLYFQHRLSHKAPLLWRLHRVHHADPDFDVSTGLRFHPLEIILSMLIKIAVVVLIGAPLLAVITFEIVLNATSLFNHGNVAIPARLERPLRYLLVTQEMHRIHHSQTMHETNSNYSFNLSLWDRLFNSYTEQAEAGSDGIRIGLSDYPDQHQTTRLPGMLMIPFSRPSADLQSPPKV